MSCVQVLELTELQCGDNEAGVTTVNIINHEDLVFPLPAVDAAPDDWTISVDLSLVDAATAGFVTWTFKEDDAEYIENANDNGNYECTLTMTLPKDDETKRNLFRKMNNTCCRYAVIVTDKNGHTKLQTDLTFKDNFTTGKGGTNNDTNQYTVTLTRTGTKAYTYEGTVPVQTP